MKSHQRIIRENKAKTDSLDNLFGSWWEGLDLDISTAECKEISLRTAAGIIKEYEYLGTMPNAPLRSYGIYFDGACGGAVIYGAISPPSVARSVCPDYSDKVIQLSRGACVHWAHPHSASKLISYSLHEIKKLGWKIVVAYADPDAGEIGTVYQATNWFFCGVTAKRPDYLLPNGKRFMGHMKKGEAALLKKTARTRKGRYVYVLGSRKEKRMIMKSLKWPIENYPKRMYNTNKPNPDK
jgi:hypothetical protein